MALGVGDLLRAAEVEVVDDDSAGPADGSAVLSLRTFWTVGEVETLANRAVEVLQDRGWGAANLRPVITEAFTELAVNVVEHAHSVIGGLALIRLSRPPEKPRFECAVADGGIGVRSALTKNPRLRDRVSYDWDALDLATRERISGTGDPSRGIGLFGVAEEMRKPGRRLLLHSGNGLLQIDERAQLQARRKPFFPGTLACVAVPT
jgi:anti-sigma regulatory factor (Ser/Thr protein kinase)